MYGVDAMAIEIMRNLWGVKLIFTGESDVKQMASDLSVVIAAIRSEREIDLTDVTCEPHVVRRATKEEREEILFEAMEEYKLKHEMIAQHK